MNHNLEGLLMKTITAKEVQEQLDEGKTLHLIDVREDDEVAEGKIPGIQHIRLGEVATRLDELDKDKAYIIVCRSGGRSGTACEFLEEQGYDVANMTGGMIVWEGEVEVE